MKINNTKLSEDITDINYINFINIVNDVIPLDIENNYVNLTNIIIDYINYSSKLIKCDNILFDLDKEIFNHDKEKQLLINKKNNLVNILNNEYNNISSISDNTINFSYELWFESKKNIENKIIKYENKINYLDDEIKMSLEERNKYSLIIKELKEQLLLIIKNISDNIKGIKEISTSNLLGKHINDIRKLDLNNKEINVLEEILKTYCRLRIISFNIIKDLSFMILNAYNNNSYLNINDKKYNIIINSLIHFNLTREENIKDLIYDPLLKTNLYLSKEIINYINGDNIDLENINRKDEYILYTPETDLIKEIIKDLNFTNKRKI